MTTLLEYTQVELLTLSGPEFRRVSTAPPRPPTEDEIPIIDLASVDKDLEARKSLASKVRAAAESTGFFYIKNHGISEELIENALSQAKAFFDQPIEKKQLASSKIQKNADGWHGLGTTQVNKTETRGNHPLLESHYSHLGMHILVILPMTNKRSQIAKKHSLCGTIPRMIQLSPTRTSCPATMTLHGRQQVISLDSTKRQLNSISAVSRSRAR